MLLCAEILEVLQDGTMRRLQATSLQDALIVPVELVQQPAAGPRRAEPPVLVHPSLCGCM